MAGVRVLLGPLNGQFRFCKKEDGTVDKLRVTCVLCKKEFVYQTGFQTATTLDPRFKDLKSLPRETREHVRTMIISRTY